MNKTYRMDYATDDQPDKPIVRYGLSRKAALRHAALASFTHGTAYAIARVGDKDVGQRVYAGGFFSHQDDQF